MSTSDADDRITHLEFKIDTLYLLFTLMAISVSPGPTSSVNIFVRALLVVIFVAQFGLYCYTYIPKS